MPRAVAEGRRREDNNIISHFGPGASRVIASRVPVVPEPPEAMAVSFEIFLPTWLLAASLASLFALLVWRTSGAEAKGELAEPPEQKTKDEPPERPQDALGAEQKAKDERDELGAARDGELDDWQFVPEPPEPQTRAGRELFVTLRAGERVHTRRKCRGLKNAKEVKVVTSTKDVVGKTPCKICFRNE